MPSAGLWRVGGNWSRRSFTTPVARANAVGEAVGGTVVDVDEFWVAMLLRGSSWVSRA